MSLFLFLCTIMAVAAKTTSPCDQLSLSSSYDAIVIGTGPGGAVAARRLAEWNPSWKVLSVERGIAYSNCSTCPVASFPVGPIIDPTTGDFITTTPQPGLANSVLGIKDCAVQGGCTSMNGEFYARGDANRFFDTYWPINWNWESMIPFYERAENYTFPPGFHTAPYSYAAELRGNSGPVQSSQLPANTTRTKFLDAMRVIFPGIPAYYSTSLNDGEHPGIGTAYPETSTVGNTRVSAYTAYMQTYTAANLKAITGTLATKLVFDSTNQVTGVQVMLTPRMAQYLNLGNQTLVQCTINSNRVVVAAGAFGTPKLLKLSGIGNPSELASFGIPLVSNVPGVGESLRDHISVSTNLVSANASVPLPYTTYGPNIYGSAYYNAANNGPNVPNDFVYEYGVNFPGSMENTVSGTNLLSVGYVRLASADPTVPPLINPNYFGVASDQLAVGLATMKAFNLTKLLGMKLGMDPCNNTACSTPQQVLAAYNKAGMIYPGYHFASTAPLCNVTNPVSMRVRGTRGLYVLDASVMPYIPSSNIQVTLYAIGERGIDMINSNMHATNELQDIFELEGWAICLISEDI